MVKLILLFLLFLPHFSEANKCFKYLANRLSPFRVSYTNGQSYLEFYLTDRDFSDLPDIGYPSDFINFVMKLDRSKRILDAPSGKNGTIVNELRSLGFENVNGIDLIIEKSAQDNNPKLQEGDMSETHYDSNYFDIIFSSYGPFSYYSEAGNYAVVAQKIFTEMVRILKNDGLLFISPATLQRKI